MPDDKTETSASQFSSAIEEAIYGSSTEEEKKEQKEEEKE